jgi:ABC-type multidrug transport system ATPase subunit
MPGRLRKPEQTEAVPCPNCWRRLEVSGARFCHHCGIDVDEWSDVMIRPRATINSIALTKSPLTIGRSEANDIRLDHPAVSARHARLEWRGADESWWLVDETSAMGTYVGLSQVPPGPDGRRMDPRADTIWIAPYSFRLVTGDRQQPRLEPAHLRLDASGLVRTVGGGRGRESLTILNLEATLLSFRPGEFIALVGGSGTGKSTLMKALLGIDRAQRGTVWIGGRPFIIDGKLRPFGAMHAITGYVPQEDVVHFSLTPLEALEYAARLRLSPDMSERERIGFMQRALEQVELWPHRDKLIRNLSGGQRKRVNIALELLAEPRILFLDEPTSGLDPGLDLSIMELLRRWATDPGDPRTIILVTHATENVTSCKYVAFMAPGGHVAYFGPPAGALHYFGVQRFAEIYRLVDEFRPPGATESAITDTQPSGQNVRDLVRRFQESQDHFRYVKARRLRAEERSPDGHGPSFTSKPMSASLGSAERDRLARQLSVLTARNWKLIRRDRMNFVTLLLQGLLVAGLLWAVADSDTFQPKGAENAQTLMFIMACAAAWMGILNATKEIVKEQDIYLRERRYGLRAAPYVLGKLAVLGAIGAVQIGTLLLLAAYHFALPDRGALGPWSPLLVEWFVTLELTLVAGLSLGLLISAATTTVDAATAVMFVALLTQVMFAGIFFADSQWADVLSVLTFSRWGLEAAGTSANLNGLLAEAVGSSYQLDKAYMFSPARLVARWAILGAFAIALTAAASWRQGRKR